MMYKIAYWLNGLGLGGTEKSAVLFSKYLSKEKYKIDFFTYDDADLTRAEEIYRDGLDIKFIDRSNPDWTPLSHYDLVHTFRAGGFEKPEKGVNFHGDTKFVVHNVFGSLSSNRYIDRDIFMSEWLMKDTLRKYGIDDNRPSRKRFTYVNNPCEIPFTNNKLSVFDDDVIVLGRSGRPTDGVYDSINVFAAKKLQDDGYKVAFLCLGCPPSMRQDMEHAEIQYHVIEPSIDVYTISEFYNSIDIYCEGRPDGHTFGSVLGEAQIHGKPCVVHQAIPRYAGMGVWQAQTKIVQNGVTGFVVDYNIDRYADAIAQLINSKDLRDKFGLQAKKRALKEFEAEACADKMDKIYLEILNNVAINR